MLMGALRWAARWLRLCSSRRVNTASARPALAAVLLLALGAAFAPQAAHARWAAGTTTPGDGQVTVSWTIGFAGADEYYLLRWRESSKTQWSEHRVNWNSSWNSRHTVGHTFTGLTNNVEYTFQIVGCCISPLFRTASGTVTATPVPPPPAAPTGVKATPGDGQVTLSWTNPGNANITRWEYQVGSGNWQKIDGSGAATTSHTVTRLNNGTSYSFKVRAAIGDQVGAESASVSATPQKAPCQPWLDDAPAGVGPDFTADVTIQSNCGNITRMEYQTKAVSAGWPSSWQTLSTESIGNNRSLSQEFSFAFRLSLSVGGPRDVRIRALNSGVAGPAETPRRIVWAGPPSAPQGLRAQPGAGSIQLTWNLAATQQAVSGWAWQSKLATASNYGGWDTISGANASTTSHTVENLTSGTAWKFRVRAINAAGDGAVSAEVTATPLGVTVSKSSLTVPEGGSGTYTVKLDAAPAENVIVTIGGASGDVTVDPASLTFTPGNYGTAQTVTVSAAEDDDAVTEALVTLTHGAQGGGLDRVAIPSVRVSVTENDTAGVTVSVSTLTITEGGSGEYTLVLDSEPSDDVTVSVLADGDLGDVRAIPSQLTFTPADWRTEQTVTVTAAEDADAKTDPAVRLTHGAAGGDYGGLRIGSVTVNVTEDDPPLKPTNVVETPGDGQVTLTWVNPRNPDITHWEIQQQARVSRNPAWTTWKRIAGSGAATASHVVENLNNGTFYAFRIRAVSAVGDGAESDDVITLPTRSGKHITLAPDGARITEGNDGTRRVFIDIILGEPAPAASGEGVSLGPVNAISDRLWTYGR